MLTLSFCTFSPQAFCYLCHSLCYYLTDYHLCKVINISYYIEKYQCFFFLVWGLRRGKRIFWTQISHFAEYWGLCGTKIIIQRKGTHIISDFKSPVTNAEHLRITMKYGCLTLLSRVKTGIDNEFSIKDWRKSHQFQL